MNLANFKQLISHHKQSFVNFITLKSNLVVAGAFILIFCLFISGVLMLVNKATYLSNQTVAQMKNESVKEEINKIKTDEVGAKLSPTVINSGNNLTSVTPSSSSKSNSNTTTGVTTTSSSNTGGSTTVLTLPTSTPTIRPTSTPTPVSQTTVVSPSSIPIPTNIPTTQPTAVPTATPQPTAIPTNSPKADLIITNAYVQSSPMKAGTWSYIMVDIKNQGDAEYFTISNISATITNSEGGQTGCEIGLPHLKPGESTTISLYCIVYKTGNAKAVITVDYNNTVVESNESNNAYELNFYVTS